MGYHATTQVCFGVILDRVQAEEFHEHLEALAAISSGVDLEEDPNGTSHAVEQALGWKMGGKMACMMGSGAHGCTDNTEWFSADDSHIHIYAAGIGTYDDKAHRKAPSKALFEQWESTFGPALAAIGVRKKPAWQVVAQTL